MKTKAFNPSKPVVFLVIVAAALSIFFFGMPEYTKTGRCYQTNSVLTERELLLRVERSLIHAETQRFLESRESLDDGNKANIYLVSNEMKANDVIEAVTSKSIATMYSSGTMLERKGFVFYVNDEMLRQGHSIFEVWDLDRIDITSLSSLAELPQNNAKEFLSGMEQWLDLSRRERALGYGNHVFTIDVFAGIPMSCCAAIYKDDPRQQDAESKKVINRIKQGELPWRQHLIVSNCGDLLYRGNSERVPFWF